MKEVTDLTIYFLCTMANISIQAILIHRHMDRLHRELKEEQK